MKRRICLLMLSLCMVGCGGARVAASAPTAVPASAVPTATPTEAPPTEAAPMVIQITLPATAGHSEPVLTPEPTPEITPEPTPTPSPSPTPEPITESATVLADGVGAVGRAFSLGEPVRIIDQKDDCYLVETETGPLLVEKDRIRRDGEPAPTSRPGYAKNGVPVYEDSYLEGPVLTTLPLNTEVTVEDAFGQLLRVRLRSGQEGYTLASNISSARIATGGGARGGQDGGDIDLGARWQEGPGIVRLGGVVRVSDGFAPGAGRVLAEGTEGYLRLFARGDTVQVLERGETGCTVLIDGEQGVLPAWALRFEDEPPYQAWNGYARQKTVLFSHYRMLDKGRDLPLNAALRVLDELPGRYVVEVSGAIGYLPRDLVSRTPIAVGGNGGAEWTDPML